MRVVRRTKCLLTLLLSVASLLGYFNRMSFFSGGDHRHPSSFDISMKRFRADLNSSSEEGNHNRTLPRLEVASAAHSRSGARLPQGARLPHRFAGFQARVLRNLIPSEELDDFLGRVDGVKLLGAHLSQDGTKTKETIVSQSRERRRTQVAWLHLDSRAPPRRASAKWHDRSTGTLLQNGSFVGERIRMAVEVGFDAWPETTTNDRRGLRYEPVQFSVYRADDVLEEGGKDGGFVGWHLDRTPSGPRRISVVVLLQKSEEGGEFELRNWNRTVERNARLEPGDAIVFPSMNTQHQVTPVVRGVRKSLVAWIRVHGTPDQPVDTSDVAAEASDEARARPEEELLALPRDSTLVSELLRASKASGGRR